MLSAVFLSVILTFSAFAQKTNQQAWDFAGPRQPQRDELMKNLSLEGDSCRHMVDHMYERYAVIHPQFRPIMSDPAVRRAWRRSLILFGKPGLSGPDTYWFPSHFTCFFQVLAEVIAGGLTKEGKFLVVHCGVIEPNLSESRLEVAKAQQELTEYAMAGELDPRYLGLVLGPLGTLNSDVRYYIVQVLNQLAPPGDMARELIAQHMAFDGTEQLNAERQRFVEEAFERGDYQAVLSTTEPCSVEWS